MRSTILTNVTLSPSRSEGIYRSFWRGVKGLGSESREKQKITLITFPAYLESEVIRTFVPWGDG